MRKDTPGYRSQEGQPEKTEVWRGKKRRPQAWRAFPGAGGSRHKDLQAPGSSTQRQTRAGPPPSPSDTPPGTWYAGPCWALGTRPNPCCPPRGAPEGARQARS